jgi:hypothetical protein
MIIQKAIMAPLIALLTCYAFSSSESKEEPRVFKEEPMVLVEAKQLTTDEMQNIRGGFIDPTGMIFNFAVNVRTALNGMEIFTRSLTISPSGPHGHFEATNNTALVQPNIPSNLSANVIGSGTGVTITDTSGNTTTVLNESAGGVPSSIVFNTSSDRDIAQSVAMTLTLKNVPAFAAFSHTAAQSALAQSASMRSLGF